MKCPGISATGEETKQEEGSPARGGHPTGSGGTSEARGWGGAW